MAESLEDQINKARGVKPASTGGGSTTTPVQRPEAVQTGLKQQMAADPFPTVGPDDSVGTALFKAGKQIVRGGENIGRVFTDEFTHGSYDKRLAPSGPDAARASTQQASDELGTGGNIGIRTMANIANPMSKISKGAGLAWSGLEGGITGGWHAYEHGGTPLDTLIGAGTGAAVGVGLPGALQGGYQLARKYAPNAVKAATEYVPKVGDYLASLVKKTGVDPNSLPKVSSPLSASEVTQNAKANADASFQTLDANKYHTPHVANVNDAIDNAVLSDPTTRSNSPRTNAIIQQFRKDLATNHANNDPTTAGAIHTQIKKLGNVINDGGMDAASAGQAKDMFTNSYQGLPPLNNTAPSVVKQFNQANADHGLFKNAEMLEGMDNDLGTFGNMPAGDAQKTLKNSPGFYNQDQKDALTAIGQSGSAAPGMTRPWATGIAGGAGAYMGHPYAGAAAGAALDVGRAVSGPAGARRSIYGAYPSMTGQAPSNPEAMLAETGKRMGFGMLSAGDGKPNPVTAIPGSLSPYVFPYMFGQ
jgi:hypothetical protein